MQDQILGAEVQSALQFSAKSFYGFREELVCVAGQVHQVVGVNHQRLQIVLVAEAGHLVTLRATEIVGLPLARAGRKYLEGVAAEAVGSFGSILDSAGNRGVNAYAAGSQARRPFGRREIEDVLLAGDRTGHEISITAVACRTGGVGANRGHIGKNPGPSLRSG